MNSNLNEYCNNESRPYTSKETSRYFAPQRFTKQLSRDCVGLCIYPAVLRKHYTPRDAACVHTKMRIKCLLFTVEFLLSAPVKVDERRIYISSRSVQFPYSHLSPMVTQYVISLNAAGTFHIAVGPLFTYPCTAVSVRS